MAQRETRFVEQPEQRNTAEVPRKLGTNFTKLLTAATISSAGDGVTFIAAPLLAATITRDPRQIAGIETALTVPWLLFSLPAGALIDRWDRRRVMWTVDALRTLITGIIAIAASTHHVTMPLLYAAFFLLGTGGVFFDNADQSFLPQVVAPDLLERANARLQTVTLGTGQLLGPAIGSLLFGVAASIPFAFDATTFAAASLLAYTIQGSFKTAPIGGAQECSTTLRTDIAEGLRYLFHHKLLRRLAFVLASMNLLDLTARATFVLFAQDRLHVEKLGFGILLTMFAIGGVVGGYVADRVAQRRPKSILAIDAAMMTAAYAIIWISNTAIAVGISYFLIGVASVWWNVVTVSARQQIIPARLFARVNSVYRLLSWGTMPIGALLGGLIAKRYGLLAPFIVACIGHVLITIAAFAWLSTDKFAAARAANET